MEKAANQLVEETQEAHDEVTNFSLEHLRDKLEYFDVKADFFENQNLILNKIINKMELKDKEFLKEEQDLSDKLLERAEVKKSLVNILKGLKNQRRVKKYKKNGTFIRINGFYHCPECLYETKRQSNFKAHMDAVHLKLKPWNCLDCTKGNCIETCNLRYF